MELKHYLRIVWKWLWLLVLSTAIAVGVSYFITSRQPKIYSASAKLLVGQSIQNANPNSQDLYTSQQLALTYVQIARTLPFLQATIDALGLEMSPDELLNMTSANIVQGTQLIELSVLDTDPVRAEALANELAHQLTLQGPAASNQEEQQRIAFVQQQVNELQTKIRDANQEIAELQKALPVTASARAILDNQQKVTTLQGQIAVWQQTYASLLAFLAPQSPNILSILEPARLPQAPVGPNTNQSLLVAAALGLLLGLGGAFLIEYLDDTIKSAEDVTELLQLPTIGSIARIPGGGNQRLVTSVAPGSSISEAYRVLRTNIQFASLDKPIRSILVTSAGPGEGKSVTAANLAVTMAIVGLRTILVDTDLRRPTQHRLFNQSNDVGVTNGLITQAEVDKIARTTWIGNLRVVTAGTIVPNPAEVLASAKMQEFKRQLEEDADIVIFDGPPVMPLADVPILARMVDGVVLVVDSVRTRREPAQRARVILQNAGANILGVVLNRFSPRSSGDDYYYYAHARAGKSKPGPRPESIPAAQSRSGQV